MSTKDHICKALDMLVGTWSSSGRMLADEGASPIDIAGTDAYRWLPGKQFMIHEADVMVGTDKVDVIEMIGEYDETKKACAMHAFQSDGSHGVMWASVNNDDSLLFTGEAIRATLVASPDKSSMDATWERLEGGQWVRWMDMHFRRVD